MHRYRAYGLTIGSELELPELLAAPPDDGLEPDAIVRLGEVPDSLDEASDQGVRYAAKRDQLLLRVDDVARFLVREGREVVVAPEPGVDDDSVRIFLLGSAFGALLHQRGLLPLHGSSIVVDGAAVCFLGRSGVGKSTLAAAFQARGYRLLGDDVSVVTLDDQGRPEVHPAYPQAKLWLDSLERLGRAPDDLRRVRPQLEKRCVPLGEGFHDGPVPLRRVFVLSVSNKDEIRIDEATGPGKFAVLKNHTYRETYLEGLELRVPHFRHVAAVVRHVDVSVVVRPQAPFRLDALVERIESELGVERP